MAKYCNNGNKDSLQYGLINITLFYKLEFRDSDVSPGQTEVKQGKFVEFLSRTKGYFRETYKSQNINPNSPTPKGCMYGQSVCFYVSPYFFSRNLICNMTTFRIFFYL